MAWRDVSSYSFGFNPVNKQVWIYYTLAGSGTAYQVMLTPAQFTAVAMAFNAAAAIRYEDRLQYFATQARQLP